MDLGLILAAFGGGLFGTAIGALPAFIFCGFLVIAGEAIAVAGGSAADVIGFTDAIGFGTLFGPHIAFAGGAAASAYAAHVKDSLEDGADILTPLLKIGAEDQVWDILVVGGVFGVLGYFLNGIFGEVLALPTDTIALTVAVSALIHRIIFCKTGIFGEYDPELSDSRWDPPASIAWLPFQMKAGHLISLGLGVGLVSGYVTLATGSVFIMFGITAASLIILETKGAGPVTHHMALPASAAAAATGSVLLGGVYGILGAVVGEFFARLFYDWGDSHIDPPACAIATLIFVTMMLHGFDWTVPAQHLVAIF